MSHFTVVVLVPQANVPEPGHPDFESQLIAKVESMLAPFDESKRVKSYQAECDCAQWTVSRKARQLAEADTGLTIEILRASWWGKTEIEREKTTWEDHIHPLTSVHEEYEKDLLRDAKPDDDCGTCKGTGFYKSTRNPLSKWDWYSVGGRWDGRYKENNIPTVAPNVAFAVDLCSAAYAPFAIISPREPHQKQRHDNWSEKGEMGWFAMVANENDNWPAIASELFGKYSGCFAVLMDCHI